MFDYVPASAVAFNFCNIGILTVPFINGHIVKSCRKQGVTMQTYEGETTHARGHDGILLHTKASFTCFGHLYKFIVV